MAEPIERKRKIEQIPFAYRGQPSCLHMERNVIELMEQRLGDQFTNWIQHQADAIMAEQPGISWLALHNILKSRIVASLANPVSTSFRGKSHSAATIIPQRLLKESPL